MPPEILEEILLTTMLIKNEWGKSGTGFVVRKLISENTGYTFLITNKHVIHEEKSRRDEASEIHLYFNVRDNTNTIRGHDVIYSLKDNNNKKLWREHPDQDTDVLVINISPILNLIKNIEIKIPDYSLLISNKTEKDQISIGEDAYVVGYPLGLKRHTTNFPLIRKCILATKLGEKLEIPTKENGKIRNRLLRGFLIDGGTSPGSSGSPILFAPPAGYFSEHGLTLGSRAPYILGIVSESRVAIIQSEIGDYPNLSGLALAFDAETIIETIELFFENGIYKL